MSEKTPAVTVTWYMTNTKLHNREITIESSVEHVNAYGQNVHEKDERTVRFKQGVMKCENPNDRKFLENHKYFNSPNPNYGFRKLTEEEVEFLEAKLIAKNVPSDQWHARIARFREVMGE